MNINRIQPSFGSCHSGDMSNGIEPRHDFDHPAMMRCIRRESWELMRSSLCTDWPTMMKACITITITKLYRADESEADEVGQLLLDQRYNNWLFMMFVLLSADFDPTFVDRIGGWLSVAERVNTLLDVHMKMIIDRVKRGGSEQGADRVSDWSLFCSSLNWLQKSAGSVS